MMRLFERRGFGWGVAGMGSDRLFEGRQPRVALLGKHLEADGGSVHAAVEDAAVRSEWVEVCQGTASSFCLWMPLAGIQNNSREPVPEGMPT
jgi:hypothetical protein